jgi:transglutaminase-like putative cysteine protease
MTSLRHHGDRLRRRLTIAAATIVVFAIPCVGYSSAAVAQTVRLETKSDLTIAPDRSLTATIEYRTTPLVESAVTKAAQIRWVGPTTESFEVIQAYTRKADGTVIAADPKDFVTQNGAVGAAMSFGDIDIHQIPFRDVAVGDTTVLIARIAERDHYLPGQYSESIVVPPDTVQRSIDVTLHSPVDMAISHDERQLAYEEGKTGDEITRHWSGTIAPAPTDEKDIVDLPSIRPGLRFSTIPSFQAIAQAYYAGAHAKLVPTPEIARLAEQITAGKSDTPAQARAIFDWVSRNIRYVAVYFGKGRLVPNDTHTILSRGFGDCKDHAVLLAALLAAKGIDSEQVLINVGAVYERPKTPTLQAFNHVIVYVPALDRYLDPTVQFGSFDHLPERDQGKPVVRVSERGATLARTPELDINGNVVTIATRMALTPEGMPQGETTVQARGDFADLLRGTAAQAEVKGKDAVLANLARVEHVVGGDFTFEAPPWTEAREPFVVTTTWKKHNRMNLVQAGWRASSGLTTVTASPTLLIGGLRSSRRVYPALCRSGKIVRTVDLELPPGIAPEPLPSPVAQAAPHFRFEELWWRDGNHLREQTEICSSVGRVCSPAEVEAVRISYLAIAAKINPLLRFTRTSLDVPGQSTPSVSKTQSEEQMRSGQAEK